MTPIMFIGGLNVFFSLLSMFWDPFTMLCMVAQAIGVGYAYSAWKLLQELGGDGRFNYCYRGIERR